MNCNHLESPRSQVTSGLIEDYSGCNCSVQLIAENFKILLKVAELSGSRRKIEFPQKIFSFRGIGKRNPVVLMRDSMANSSQDSLYMPNFLPSISQKVG